MKNRICTLYDSTITEFLFVDSDTNVYFSIRLDSTPTDSDPLIVCRTFEDKIYFATLKP